MLDFVRRLNTGQLPAHWHFDAFGDFSLPVEIIRMLFNNEDRPKSTAPWFLEQVLEYDDFPVNDIDDCAICLEKLIEKDCIKLRVIKDGESYGCGHVFHKSCCENWLKQANVCPLCRGKLPEDDREEELKQMEERYIRLQQEQQEREKRAANFSSTMFG